MSYTDIDKEREHSDKFTVKYEQFKDYAKTHLKEAPCNIWGYIHDLESRVKNLEARIEELENKIGSVSTS